MMKKTLILACVAVMVMGLTASAFAIDDYWLVQMRAQNGTLSQGTCTYGTKTGYDDGNVLVQDVLFPSPINGAGEVVCIDLGGDTPRWQKDQRAPMLPLETKIWNLRAYVNGAAEGSVDVLFWMPSSAKLDSDDLDIYIQYDGKRLFTFDQGTSGSSSAPQFTHTFDYTGGGVDFQLVAAPIPEPGSMLAMLSGLVGLVGFGIRRRK